MDSVTGLPTVREMSRPPGLFERSMSILLAGNFTLSLVFLLSRSFDDILEQEELVRLLNKPCQALACKLLGDLMLAEAAGHDHLHIRFQ